MLAKSIEDRVAEAVASLVPLVEEMAPSRPVSMAIHFQEGGEVPYSIVVPEETLPMIGLAVVPRDPAPRSAPRPSEAATRVEKE